MIARLWDPSGDRLLEIRDIVLVTPFIEVPTPDSPSTRMFHCAKHHDEVVRLREDAVDYIEVP